MDLCLDFFRAHDALDDSVPVHQVGRPESAYGLVAARHFLSPAPEGLKQLGGGVGDERELEAEVLRELGL